MRKPVLEINPGDKFGELTVIKELPVTYDKTRTRKIRWAQLKCSCGRIVKANFAYLRQGTKTDCGHVYAERRAVNMEKGEKHNLLEFIKEVEPREYRSGLIRFGEFKCDCGKTHYASISAVRHNLVRSCGCLKKPSKKIDGENSIRKQKRTGLRCSECGILFKEPAGKPVLCKDCWDRKQLKRSKVFPPLSSVQEL